MPGFMNKSTAVSVFHVDNPAAVTAEGLKRGAFRPIDALKREELAFGCVNIADILDTSWATSPPEKGEWMCFALRVDKRTVPGAVLKKCYAEALKAEQEAQERKTVSRARKKELREQVKARLSANIEPAPNVVDVAVNMNTGQVLASSVAKGLLEHLETVFVSSFGVKLERKHPADVPSQGLRAVYDDMPRVEYAGHTYTLADAGHVTLCGSGDSGSVTVAVKNDRASADAGLASGLSIVKLKATMERDGESDFNWTFTLISTSDGGLAFSGLKTPSVKSDDKDDPDAVLLEKLYLLELAVGVVHAQFMVK